MHDRTLGGATRRPARGGPDAVRREGDEGDDARGRDARGRRARHGDAIREILEGGVEAGAFALEDPEVTATLLFVAMHAFDPHFHGPEPWDDERLVRVTQQLFRPASGAPDAGESG
jgi:hypothetical protein